MKDSEAGRNDPCPCGSGKKFKKCCLDREGTPPPGDERAGVFAEIRQALETRKFSSLEDAQVFTDGFMRQRNQAAVDDFHGLTPEQMHRMLNFPFSSPQLVKFADVLATEPAAPVITLLDLLVKAVGAQGLKQTDRGNLPRGFCREAAQAFWGEVAYRENTRHGGINKEEDFLDLHVTRLVAGLAGLIRTYKGKFILSRDCQKRLTEDGMRGIYPRFLRAYVENYNWAYRDRYSPIRFIQSSFLFTLYLLTRYGGDWRPRVFYEDCFIRAFPMVLSEVEPSQVFTPEQEVRSCYMLRTFVHFTGLLGLAAVEPLTQEIIGRQYRVKALPLLREAVQFQGRII